MMSRKHYILIAEALGRAIARAKLGYAPLRCLTDLEISLKLAFEKDNPAFDADRFGDAINKAISSHLEYAEEGGADSSVEAALRPEDHEHEEVV